VPQRRPEYAQHSPAPLPGPALLAEAEAGSPGGPNLHYRRTIADLQKVPDNCGGAECYALISKQVKSCGALLWNEKVCDRERELSQQVYPLDPDQVSSCLSNHTFHLRAFIFASDQGPDQVGADQKLNDVTDCLMFILKFRQWCLQHCVHLIVARQLVALGTYFANIAKIVHCVRNNMKLLYRIAVDQWGKKVADEMFSRMPSRPLRGRWGSTFAAERDLFKLGLSRLRLLFKIAFKPKTKAKKRKAAVDAIFVADIEHENETFQEKRSRWVNEALKALESEELQLTMHVSHTSREPTEHARTDNI
jgi:hypothetical protein